MSSHWQRKANEMFGAMPQDITEAAKEAISELLGGNTTRGRDHLQAIDNYLSEYPTTGMLRLGITKEELSGWREKYKN